MSHQNHSWQNENDSLAYVEGFVHLSLFIWKSFIVLETKTIKCNIPDNKCLQRDMLYKHIFKCKQILRIYPKSPMQIEPVCIPFAMISMPIIELSWWDYIWCYRMRMDKGRSTSECLFKGLLLIETIIWVSLGNSQIYEQIYLICSPFGINNAPFVSKSDGWILYQVNSWLTEGIHCQCLKKSLSSLS